MRRKRRLLAGLRRSSDNDDQVTGLDRSLRGNFRRSLWKVLFNTLEVLEHFRSALGNKEGLNGIPLRTRKLAYLRNANRHDWQIRIQRQLLQVLDCETVLHVDEGRQPQIRLVDAVEPNRLVVVHPRKRRL